MASDVYCSDLRTGFSNSLLDKLGKLMERAGIGNIDFQDHYAAIKMHFGEPGNLAFLRPNWAKTVADEVRKRGGKPFLTDCNTLWQMDSLPSPPAVRSSSATASRAWMISKCL